ncbi:AcaB family transcriptional regulator [Endothiovibrio diazotrophicus]
MNDPIPEPPREGGRPALAGRLQQHFTLTLHTRHAQALYAGRGGHRSLLQFANAAFHLRAQSALDRPLADACLLEIETAFDHLYQDLTLRRADLETMLREVEVDGLTLSVAVSEQPAVYEGESFGSPYGYRAVAVLTLFDKLALLLHTANGAALISNQARSDEIEAYAHRFRRVFETTVARHARLRQADLALSSADCLDPERAETLAEAVRRLMLPPLAPELITGVRRPVWAFERRPAESAADGHVPEPESESESDPEPGSDGEEGGAEALMEVAYAGGEDALDAEG